MIGRPFQVDWDPEDTPEALRAAYRAQQDTMLRTRLHALWLLRSGRRMREVSTVLGFADEMRVGLRGTVRRVRGRRGVKVRQRVPQRILAEQE